MSNDIKPVEGLFITGKFISSGHYTKNDKTSYFANILVNDRFTYSVTSSSDIFEPFKLGDSITVPVFASCYNDRIYYRVLN